MLTETNILLSGEKQTIIKLFYYCIYYIIDPVSKSYIINELSLDPLQKNLSSCEKLTEFTAFVWSLNSLQSSSLFKSHIITFPSSKAIASWFPSEVKAKCKTSASSYFIDSVF